MIPRCRCSFNVPRLPGNEEGLLVPVPDKFWCIASTDNSNSRIAEYQLGAQFFRRNYQVLGRLFLRRVPFLLAMRMSRRALPACSTLAGVTHETLRYGPWVKTRPRSDTGIEPSAKTLLVRASSHCFLRQACCLVYVCRSCRSALLLVALLPELKPPELSASFNFCNLKTCLVLCFLFRQFLLFFLRDPYLVTSAFWTIIVVLAGLSSIG